MPFRSNKKQLFLAVGLLSLLVSSFVGCASSNQFSDAEIKALGEAFQEELSKNQQDNTSNLQLEGSR